MKYPAVLGFADILPELDQFDTIIDARSESEYALDRIPGAISCPGQYDGVRRSKDCEQPGSCSQYPGSPICTSYH